MTQPSKDEILELLRLHEEYSVSLGKSGRILEMPDLDLHRMDLSGRQLTGIVLPGVNFSNCKMFRTDLYYSFLPGASFVDADFAEGCLVKANVSESVCTGCVMHGANLVRVSFYKAELRRVDFSKAVMIKAFIHGADLRESNFSGANIDRVSFSEVDLRGATGFETVEAEWILADNGKIEGVDNIREWLFEASRL